MKLALIGVGQAGGKILDQFIRYDQRTGSNVVRSAVVYWRFAGGEWKRLDADARAPAD